MKRNLEARVVDMPKIFKNIPFEPLKLYKNPDEIYRNWPRMKFVSKPEKISTRFEYNQYSNHTHKTREIPKQRGAKETTEGH